MSAIENALFNKLLGVKEESEIPVILVRRSLPHPLTSKMHETGWVGLRKTMRRGKVAFEKDHNFKLAIDTKGVAEIPDCEENRQRLDKLCQPRVKRVVVRERNGRGIMAKKLDAKGNTVYQEEVIPPLYERLDVAVLGDNLLDAIVDRIEARAAARSTENFEADESDDVPEAKGKGKGARGGARRVTES